MRSAVAMTADISRASAEKGPRTLGGESVEDFADVSIPTEDAAVK